jgi:hypothetical protein
MNQFGPIGTDIDRPDLLRKFTRAYKDRLALRVLYGEKLCTIPNFSPDLAETIASHLHPVPKFSHFIFKAPDHDWALCETTRKSFVGMTRTDIARSLSCILSGGVVFSQGRTTFSLRYDGFVIQTLTFGKNSGEIYRKTVWEDCMDDIPCFWDRPIITEECDVLLIYLYKDAPKPFEISRNLEIQTCLLHRAWNSAVGVRKTARKLALRSEFGVMHRAKCEAIDTVNAVKESYSVLWRGLRLDLQSVSEVMSSVYHSHLFGLVCWALFISLSLALCITIEAIFDIPMGLEILCVLFVGIGGVMCCTPGFSL